MLLAAFVIIANDFDRKSIAHKLLQKKKKRNKSNSSSNNSNKKGQQLAVRQLVRSGERPLPGIV